MSSYRTPYDTALETLTQVGSPFQLGPQTFAGIEYPNTYVNAPKSLIELMQAGREHGSKEFLVFQDERWTFDDFFEQADKLSHQLTHRYGIKSGDRVAIAMRNYPEWLVAFTAIVHCGAIAVPLNSWGKQEELRQNIDDADVALLVCDLQRAVLIQPAELNLRAIVARTEGEPLPDSCAAYDEVIDDANSVPVAERLPVVNIDPEDTAMIMFTSGTSGKPKGAVFSHRGCSQAVFNFEALGAAAYLTNMEKYQNHARTTPIVRALLSIPLFHVSALFSQFLLNLRGGRPLVLMYKWDAAEACRLVHQEQISTMAGAPSMLLDLLRHPDFETIDHSHLINLSVGGAATPAKLLALVREKAPTALSGAGWGMTESTSVGASFTGHFIDLKPKASGFPAPIVEMRFCNDAGDELPAGEAGEIWIKSPGICTSYYQNPQASAETFQDGWLRTGDVGYLDEDGCLYICDRVKDMVNRNGENIYPVEIENCLQSMPGVEFVVAFGIPSEQHGEELAVVIKTRDNNLTEADVQGFCKQHLAHFKVPSKVAFTDQDFPRNATSKVLKKEVRAMFFPE
ncbi:acyl--CoA ligase [Aestuariicella hydrocarbonica]|uniref:Acyl--CoA ligase n=1 Tax=Pseudomaricurvus hydrocarbonicus TaxID=1470433 RepID=A0A9E5JT43_9GAMM|nr:class I adenylate-forming enzyme family protein [Aestuariicella hydrocarbonica]NHO66044.1 acyl--CoA ligase [Aestuariicella hydrocarbonica]